MNDAGILLVSCFVAKNDLVDGAQVLQNALEAIDERVIVGEFLENADLIVDLFRVEVPETPLEKVIQQLNQFLQAVVRSRCRLQRGQTLMVVGKEENAFDDQRVLMVGLFVRFEQRLFCREKFGIVLVEFGQIVQSRSIQDAEIGKDGHG